MPLIFLVRPSLLTYRAQGASVEVAEQPEQINSSEELDDEDEDEDESALDEELPLPSRLLRESDLPPLLLAAMRLSKRCDDLVRSAYPHPVAAPNSTAGPNGYEIK